MTKGILGNFMENLLTLLKSILKKSFLDGSVSLGEVTIAVPKKDIVSVLTQLRDHPDIQCQQLMDLCGVDYPNRADRFEVVYHLLSLTHNHRIRIKVSVEEGGDVPSVIGVYKGAGWWEREAWDLFGIPFEGHPDLRRILTDYGFEGHPLRKDFPLTGYTEVIYDPEQRRVVKTPVSLPQDFRVFDFMSPWEGTDIVKAMSKDEGGKNG